MQAWKSVIQGVWNFLDDQKRRYSITMFGLMSIYLIGLLPPQLVGFGVNAIAINDVMLFVFYAAGAALMIGLTAICRLLLKQQMAEIQEEVVYSVRTKGYERLMAFSLDWHDQELSGNKMQRIINGCQSLRNMFNLTAYSILWGITTIVGSIGFMIVMYAPLGLVMTLYIMLFLLTQRSFYSRMLRMQEDINVAAESAGGTYVEAISNVLAVKATGSQSHIVNTVIAKEELTKRSSIALRWLSTQKWMSFQAISAGVLLVYFILIAYGYIQNQINIGQILIFYSYFNLSWNSLSDIAGMIDELIASKVGVERMLPIFNQSQLQHQGTQKFPKKWSTISLSHAVFSYGDEPQQRKGLNGLSFTIKQGEKIGIVGTSGSGKSTLAKIIIGLYSLKSGNFMIDRQQVSLIDTQEWLDHVGIVLQESELFALSFKENITLLRPFDPVRFADAIERSGCSGILEKLPQGIDTQLGEKGYHLSGGERQRIGIARALYKQPQILIMDEATSSLDPKTEAIVQRNIIEDRSITLLVIAHRYHTLEKVDRVVVVEKGNIVEEGKYAELLSNPSSYFSLLNRVSKKRV